MNKLSLFSGIGGIDLAAKWANMTTVAFCENAPYPQKVLRKHWPDIPIYEDVRSLTRARLEEDGIITANRAIDIISAGYPCQPESLAGKRRGKDDNRWLWPQVARLLQELRPRWFVGENVAGHATMGLDKVLTDLENLSYSWQPFDIPAAAVDAEHERRRIFIVAHSNSERSQGGALSRSSSEMWKRAQEQFSRLLPASPQPKVSSADFSREGYGLSRRLDEDRLKALGNAVYPYQIFPILAAIKAIDDMGREGRA